MSITLTGKEIRDLARVAGFLVEADVLMDEEYMEIEYTISECPAEGVWDEEGNFQHYKYVAVNCEYPEAGAFGLGDAEAGGEETG